MNNQVIQLLEVPATEEAAVQPSTSTAMFVVQSEQSSTTEFSSPISENNEGAATEKGPQEEKRDEKQTNYKLPASLEVSPASKKDIVAEAASKIFVEDEEVVDKKPIITNPTRGRGRGGPVVRQGGPVGVGRPRGGGLSRGAQAQRQQILPRLQLLEEEDDGLTCRLCLKAYW